MALDFSRNLILEKFSENKLPASSCQVKQWIETIMFFFSQSLYPNRDHLMCSSRKNPYPPHGRSSEIPGGRGGLKSQNFRTYETLPSQGDISRLLKALSLVSHDFGCLHCIWKTLLFLKYVPQLMVVELCSSRKILTHPMEGHLKFLGGRGS